MLRRVFSLGVSLMALVRLAALVATHGGHSRAEIASLLIQLSVWLAAAAITVLEGHRGRERSTRVLLLCGLDWLFRSLELYSDLTATPTRLGAWDGGITVASYSLVTVLFGLAVAVGYRQSCSEVEGKRMETYMLLRRSKSFPKVLRLLILAAKDKLYIGGHEQRLCMRVRACVCALWYLPSPFHCRRWCCRDRARWLCGSFDGPPSMGSSLWRPNQPGLYIAL